MSYFLEPCSHEKSKSDLKSGTGIEISKFGKNTHLVSLQSDVDKSNIEKLKFTSVNLLINSVNSAKQCSKE